MNNTCPQCGFDIYATYYEHQYGVAPEVAIHRGWPLGHQWAICLQGHRWVPALLTNTTDEAHTPTDPQAEAPRSVRDMG